jgi:hypothetical protein
MIKYVPVLKWKTGEKDAIKKLDKSQLEEIFPVIELVDSIDTNSLLNEIREIGLNHAFIDTSHYDETDFKFYKDLAADNNLYIIPVFYIDDLFNNISSVANQFDEICIRLAIPEPLDSLSYTELFKKIFKKEINLKIDLILDLIFVQDMESASLKYVALNQILSQLEKYHNNINKVIISSTSFPENLNSLEAGGEQSYKRYEFIIFNKLLENPNCKNLISKLIYSDYGVNKFTDTEMDFSRLQYGVLPKIKYTLDNSYYVQKGEKDRIRNVYTVSVFDMCDKIVKSKFFYGQNFSYGDNQIYTKSIDKRGPGGNKDWVTISTVHHIAVILKQISNYI